MARGNDQQLVTKFKWEKHNNSFHNDLLPKSGTSRVNKPTFINMRPYILTLMPLALLGLVIGVIQLLEFAENPSFKFASYGEMERSGMFEAGWLPDYLPRSATKIEGNNNIDTNAVWAKFRYRIGDVESAKEACQKIEESGLGMKFVCPPFDSRTSTLVLRSDGCGTYLSYSDGL